MDRRTTEHSRLTPEQRRQHRLEDVVAVVPGSYDVERVWHERFAHLRVPADECGGTEWFHAAPELLSAITAAAEAAGTSAA